MRILKCLPEIKIFSVDGEDVICTEIKTLQNIDETEKTVTLQFAEFNPIFKRGLVCDIQYEFGIVDKFGNNTEETYSNSIFDLVLVYINKECDMDYTPQFTYVFYK